MSSTNDYTPTTSGALKLKGPPSNPSNPAQKKKKKRPKPNPPPEKPQRSEIERKAPESAEENPEDASDGDRISPKPDSEVKDPTPQPSTKTPAELRHEERRRRKLNERLKREGIKTHKERVEELNRYLSNLSEHHDMPRIGPG